MRKKGARAFTSADWFPQLKGKVARRHRRRERKTVEQIASEIRMVVRASGGTVVKAA